jgi:hypothetical protein
MKYSELKQLIREVLEEDLPETPESSEETPVEDIPPAPAPTTPEGEITLDQAKQMILNTKGGFFTVTFIKKDGTPRVMNARLGVKKHLKGGELKYDARSMGYIPVFDMQKREYRMVNSGTILSLNIGKKKYEIIPDPGTPAAELAETKRMQKLAGILNEVEISGDKETFNPNFEEWDLDFISPSTSKLTFYYPDPNNEDETIEVNYDLNVEFESEPYEPSSWDSPGSPGGVSYVGFTKGKNIDTGKELSLDSIRELNNLDKLLDNIAEEIEEYYANDEPDYDEPNYYYSDSDRYYDGN